MTKNQLDELKDCIKETIEIPHNKQIKQPKQFKPKLEFSKKIYRFGEKLVLTITLFTMIVIWRTGDLSPLMYLIPAIFGVFGTATGFYYWKSKAENIAKYAKDGVEISENLKGNE